MKSIFDSVQKYQSILSKLLTTFLLLYFLQSLYSKLEHKTYSDEAPKIQDIIYYTKLKPTSKEPIDIQSNKDWENKLKDHINNEKPFYYGHLDCLSNNQPNECLDVDLSIILHDADHLNIIIRPRGVIFPEIPHEAPFPSIRLSKNTELKDSGFDVLTTDEKVMIRRKDTNHLILEMYTKDLIFNQKLRNFKFLIPTTFNFGDMFKIFITPGLTSDPYSHFPFYIQEDTKSNYHAVFFRNQQVSHMTLVDSKPDSSRKLCQWKTTQGVIDLHIFLGGNGPESAVSKMQSYFGGWKLPSFWALGHHEIKTGYHSNYNFEKFFTFIKKSPLPIEALISDLNVLKNHEVTKDEMPWNMTEIKEHFIQNKLKWILKLNTWAPFDRKDAEDKGPDYLEHILKGEDGHICLGLSDNKPVIILNNSSPDTFKFWSKILDELMLKFPFDGVYLSFPNFNSTLSQEIVSTCIEEDYPAPFKGPTNLKCEEQYNQLRFSHLYLQSYVSNHLSAKSSHQLILSEETMAGSGQFSGKYLNVEPTWKGLKLIISEIFKSNFFGIPFAGTSFCGQATVIDHELCVRWYQVVALAPMIYINHVSNKHYEYLQHPEILPGSLTHSVLMSIELRYSLLKYIYALFVQQEDLVGGSMKIGTVYKPLFSVFPQDPNAFNTFVILQQFMIGPNLMVATLSERDHLTARVIFPKGYRWYDLRTLLELPTGTLHDVSADISEQTPHFLMGGAMLFREYSHGVKKLSDLKNSFEIVAAVERFKEIDSKMESTRISAKIYVDRGMGEKSCWESSCLFNVELELEKYLSPLKLKIRVKISGGDEGSFFIRGVTVLAPGEGFETFDRVYSVDGELKYTDFRATFDYVSISIKNLKVKAGAMLEFILE